MVRILGESIPFSFTLTSSRNDQLVTAVKTMDDASLNYDAVEKLFTLLTKKKYPHLTFIIHILAGLPANRDIFGWLAIIDAAHRRLHMQDVSERAQSRITDVGIE